MKSYATITSVQDLVNLFPQNSPDINERTQKSIDDTRAKLDALVSIPENERTYENTMRVFDLVCTLSDMSIMRNVLSALELVSPDKAIRDACHAAVEQMNNFSVDALENNEHLYKALKSYAARSVDDTTLTQEQRYFIEKTIEDYERNGLNLPPAERELVGKLKKELAKLEQDFEVNIATDNRTITVDKAGLKGCSDEFITSLKKAENDRYLLGVDYPTYHMIMEHCSVVSTRKALYDEFVNRGYPKNQELLEAVIAKRDQLAHILGFKSYAEFDLADQMVETPVRAEQFLHDLYARASKKEKQEFKELFEELPESVVLTNDGKINPWDLAYLKAWYKEKHLTLDDRVVAQYFPMETTVDGLLHIYEQFLSLRFKKVLVQGLWHEDVTLIETYDANTHTLLGYLLLDLYPRDNKFSHACECTIISAVIDEQGNKPIAANLVIANFPKATATTPALLKYDDVNTFFHEFGHAMHDLLGRTAVASLSGTHVKRDFVEMPSQMLEEWLCDKGILRLISRHYTTGNPLPDDLIASIIKSKRIDSGYWTDRQIFFSQLSLDYFKAGATKDVYGIMKKMHTKMVPSIAFAPDNHFYASFGHLMGYGAKYYGYLWSKVFALDMFNEIKKQGLLDPVMGARYIREVIGQGGSKDPNELVRNFLGREPNQEAFLKDMNF